MKTIQVYVKNVYGTQKAYPACDTAKLLAQLTGRKTFTEDDAFTIEQLGYSFEIVSNIEEGSISERLLAGKTVNVRTGETR